MSPTSRPLVADAQELEQLRRLAGKLSGAGTASCFLVNEETGERYAVPQTLFSILAEAAQRLAQGCSVMILHLDQELTTQQAAEILQVSRPYVVRLLEQGKIAYRKVGTHRRIRLQDLMSFRERRDALRHAQLGELIRATESLGLYENEVAVRDDKGHE
ncbi:MAG: helix-turn-helix domain-containing protein [Thermaerobacter sp.]|nr:helix-turn-helix domain-containing protein [Thermaerobacter sp.]